MNTTNSFSGDESEFHDFCHGCHGDDNTGAKYCSECDWML